MSALPEGGDWRDGGPVPSPFAKTELLRVVHCRHLSCPTDATAGSVVEVRFGPSGNVKRTCETVESVRHFSKRSEGIMDVLRICIASNARAVCERCLYARNSAVELGEECFYERKNLRGVSFGRSSKLERICVYAFSGTSIESLSIPDGAADLM